LVFKALDAFVMAKAWPIIEVQVVGLAFVGA